jgi:hypothetical protein
MRTVLSTLAATLQQELKCVGNSESIKSILSCDDYFKLYSKSLPRININAYGDDDELVCSLPTFFVKLDAGFKMARLQQLHLFMVKDGLFCLANCL